MQLRREVLRSMAMISGCRSRSSATQARKPALNSAGSSAAITSHKVSWLAMPCWNGKTRRRNPRCSVPHRLISTKSSAPAIVAQSRSSRSLHLAEISRQVSPGTHAVVVLDGVGWHQLGGRPQVPANLSLLHLPPYPPELNPVENI
jgi:DDE superfamily endonuclease